tara:strand:+ start:747 stop:1112 length:366 start_codon:yes stop_codon:yes gene_type:complete
MKRNMKNNIASVTSVDENGNIKITYNFNKDSKEFKSNNFIKNWYDCTKFKIGLDNQEFDFIDDSSIDEYVKKNSFDLKYLSNPNGEWGLTDKRANHLAVKYYVEKDTNPSWLELRKICEDY